MEEITRDTDRDNWMTPEEALKYGLIDQIVVSRDGGDKKKDKK